VTVGPFTVSAGSLLSITHTAFCIFRLGRERGERGGRRTGRGEKIEEKATALD